LLVDVSERLPPLVWISYVVVGDLLCARQVSTRGFAIRKLDVQLFSIIRRCFFDRF